MALITVVPAEDVDEAFKATAQTWDRWDSSTFPETFDFAYAEEEEVLINVIVARCSAAKRSAQYLSAPAQSKSAAPLSKKTRGPAWFAMPWAAKAATCSS